MLLKPFMPYIYVITASIILGLVGTSFYYKYQRDTQKVNLVTMENLKNNALAQVEAKEKEIEHTKRELLVLQTTNAFHKEQIDKLQKEKELSDDLLKQVLKRNATWSGTALPDELRQYIKDIQNGGNPETRVPSK